MTVVRLPVVTDRVAFQAELEALRVGRRHQCGHGHGHRALDRQHRVASRMRPANTPASSADQIAAFVNAPA
jgi:hypothetical protein